MKVAIVCSGHDDSAIPMAKAISEFAYVEMFFILTVQHKNNIFINLDKDHVINGLQNEDICKKAIDPEVFKYIDGKFNISLFVYKSFKIKSSINFKLSVKFAAILRKFNIIHVNGKISLLSQFRPLLFSKKFVFTIHDLENHSGEKAKNFIARMYNMIIIKSKSHVVIQNKTDFKFITEKYPKKSSTTHFIPFGTLDIYRMFQPSINVIPPGDVLFFGRISVYKGLEYFVEAIKILKKDFPDIKYTIAGKGEFYFDDTEIKNDPNCFIFNRFISNIEMAAMFKACKVVVCPYIDATQSGVAMTAFTFNKPVIATKTGGFLDIINDGINGYLVPVKNSIAISEKLKIFFEEPHKIQEFEKNISTFERESEFAWNHIAENYIKVYKLAMG